MPSNQRYVYLPDWLNAELDDEVNRIQSNRDKRNRAQLIGIWHTALAMYFCVPEFERLNTARELQLSNAPKGAITSAKQTRWFCRVIEAMGKLNSHERELLTQTLEGSPSVLVRSAQEFQDSLRKAAEQLQRDRSESRTSSSGSQSKPKPGRPRKK